MGQFDLFRPLSEEEKHDILPLGGNNLLNKFLKELSKKVTEYQKKLRPYDSYGARIDFDNKIASTMKELSSSVDPATIKKFDFGDLDQYGNLDRFEYLEKIEQKNTRLVAGIKQEVVIGWRYRFKSKIRGNKLSIFVDNEKVEEFEKWLNETFLKKKKEVSTKPKEETKGKSGK